MRDFFISMLRISNMNVQSCTVVWTIFGEKSIAPLHFFERNLKQFKF